MSNGRNALKIDRDSISNFQKELYNGDKTNPNVGTRFSLECEKRSQASHIKIKLDQVPVREGQIVYTASKKFDFLFKLEAHISLFPIKVKEEYSKTISICYHHNLGHNILPMGECKIDDEHFEYIDSIWQDIYAQYFITNRNLYNKMIGNIESLQNWTNTLPGITLVVPQHFSFARKTQVSLPLLKSSNNSVTFEYKIRTKLIDLLRMRYFHNGEYKEIKCNLKYLEGFDKKPAIIPTPELWGRYSEITDEERNWRKSIDDDTKAPIKQIIYMEDIDITSSKNPKTIGTTDVIPLESKDPAKHIFWVASLIDGNFSNYTTNRSDLFKGWNPCAKTGIKYGGSDRVEELSHEHFDLSEAYNFNWPSTPVEPGYNVYTYTFNPNHISNADSAVILKECGASLNVTLGDTNPFLVFNEEEEHKDENGEFIPIEILKNENSENLEKYTIHVRTLVSKKLEVYWEHTAGRLKYDFV